MSVCVWLLVDLRHLAGVCGESKVTRTGQLLVKLSLSNVTCKHTHIGTHTHSSLAQVYLRTCEVYNGGMVLSKSSKCISVDVSMCVC